MLNLYDMRLIFIEFGLFLRTFSQILNKTKNKFTFEILTDIHRIFFDILIFKNVQGINSDSFLKSNFL